MTQVKVHLTSKHITDFEQDMYERSHHSKVKKTQQSYSSTCPTREALDSLFMRQHCIFMFLFICLFLNLRNTFSDKKCGFGFGEIKGLALNVAKQTD